MGEGLTEISGIFFEGAEEGVAEDANVLESEADSKSISSSESSVIIVEGVVSRGLESY